MINTPWPFKYRPSTLENFIFQDENSKASIQQFIKNKDIPHLIFSGHRGTGKTTLAYILKNELDIDDIDFLEINASHENSVDTIRNKVTGFITTHAIGPFKIILLNEVDFLSINGQAILRGVLEDEDYYKNARFILTYNLGHKVMPELKSRCQEFVFKSLNKEELLMQVAVILKKEKVKITSIELVETYINLYFPDFRKILNSLQQNTIDGKLQPLGAYNETDAQLEYKLIIVDLFEKGNWQEIREVVAKNVEGEEWVELYRFFYDYLNEIGKFKNDTNKWKAGIVIIADHLYRHNISADAGINFVACIIKLMGV